MKRMLSFVLIILMMLSYMPSAVLTVSAFTFNGITYEKQICRVKSDNSHKEGLCNVASLSNLLKRKASLEGVKSNYTIKTIFDELGISVEERKCNKKEHKKVDRTGYYYTNSEDSTLPMYNKSGKTYRDENGVIECTTQYHSAINSSKKLKDLLDMYPEGVFVRYKYAGQSGGHAIVVTKYQGEQFYCIDPVYADDGEIKLEKANDIPSDFYSYIREVLTIKSSKKLNRCLNCANIGTKAFKFNVVKDDKYPNDKSKYHAKCTEKGCDGTYTYSTLDTSVSGKYTRKRSNYSNLCLRAAPYTHSATVIEDKKYDSIEVVGVVKNADGGEWYKVKNSKAPGGYGYIVRYKVDADYDPSTESHVGMSNVTWPNNWSTKKLKIGQSGKLRATFDSKYEIKEVAGYIMKSDDSVVQDKIVTYSSPSKKTYIIDQSNTINQNLKFGKLSEGTYYVKFVVKDKYDKSFTFKSETFTVGTVPKISQTAITGGRKITISHDNSSAQLYYSLDGSKEKTISNGGSFEIKKAGEHTVKAWVKNGTPTTASVSIPKAKTPSILQLAINPGPIMLADVDIDVDYTEKCAYVTISGEGNLYYTTNGTTPTTGSKRYTEPFPIDRSTTVKAISVQDGYAPSDVATKEIIVREPDAPVIKLYNTKDKIAQGKTATVSWDKVPYATNYIASLYLNGEFVEDYETTGNIASFNLSKRSDTENFNYTIKVKAENFVGLSPDSNASGVTAMHPVTVTFVDRITRTGELTESKLAEVKRRIDDHDGEGMGSKVEGQVISVQKVDYDTLPSKPAVPSKKGFDFAGWSAEMFEPAVADATVYADFEIKYYTVKFYDVNDDFSRSERPISDARYMYTDKAVPPNNHRTEAGYVLSGWTLDVVNSQGTGYDYVDGDMIYDMACQWENVDLPTLVEITNITRKNDSYSVKVRIKNTNAAVTQGRVVVALYTAEGRHVYSTISEKDLPLGTYRDWTDIDEITLNYNQKVSCVKAYIVGVKDDKTGGALSPETDKSVCYDIELSKDSNFWGKWSAFDTKKITASDTVQVEEKTQYRYRDLQTTTSKTANYLDGWGNAYQKETHVGSWKSNGSNPISAVDNVSLKREVTKSYTNPVTKTQYRYGRWTNGSKVHFCPQTGKSQYGGTWSKQYTSWQDSAVSINKGTRYYCSNTSHTHVNPNYYSGNTANWYYYTVGGKKYYWQETQTVETKAGYYTYQYRDTTYTYHFKRYGGWSEWLDEKPANVNGREIETRTVYRYRECVYDPDSEQEAPTLSNEFKPIEGVLDTNETEYITEEDYNSGEYTYIGGPYYKDDNGEYVEIQTEDITQYRYGRYTNGTYIMPCKELADEIYGGEWSLEYTEWSETKAEMTGETVYSCDNIEHLHADAMQEDGINYWNEYSVDGKVYCLEESRVLTQDVTYTDKTKYYLVNKSLEGKVATVLAYKKINTDPTQGQLQYATQIKIGKGNTYHIEINPKEMVEYGITGDFVVSLALEGSRNLITVGVIKAEPPKHEISFFVNGEAYIPDVVRNNYEVYVDEEDGISKYKEFVDGEEVVRFANAIYIPEGMAVDVNELGIPEIEGYRFVKWDKSLVNITGRLDVNAVLEKEDYAVVFVDHENETVELQELYYGDPISSPDVAPVEGKIFKGWDNQSYRYVLEEDKDNVHYTVVDGPYYKMTDEKYIPVEAYSDEELVDGTKYYRVITDELPVVTGNMVITAIWESLVYNVKFCDSDGTVINEQEVEYGEAAMPPACITVEGVARPWNTNGQTWWNVTEDMVIYPYDYTPNDVVAPVSDTASGTYEGSQVVYLETQDETPIYYTLDMEITDEEAQEFITDLVGEDIPEGSGNVEVIEEISLASVETIEDDSDEEMYEGDEGMSLSDFIYEYDEPILIDYSSFVYAFTVKDGKVSPISVYHYEIVEPDYSDDFVIDPDMAQITMPNITAKPGETVTIPVSIKNNPGVSNLSLVFAYDAENLKLLKAENGDVFKNSEYSSDLRADGSCKFTWLSSTENTNDGTLLSLQFKVGEKGGNYSIDMSIEEAETSEEEMPFVTQDANIENVGDKAMLGDVNGDGNINFADAIILLRYDIGFTELTDYQKSISDVNDDGDVDFADAIKILRYDAGLISSLR